jgi:hypothetical protein
MARFTLGLDLGQAQDYSALVIVAKEDDRREVRDISRWPLGTPYPQIVRDVRGLVYHPLLDNPDLVVDATGCGRPVVDLFKAADCKPIGVMITGGNHATQDPETSYWHIPKKELVSTVQVALQSSALHIARALPEAATLTEELVNFQAKITTAANEQDGEWRSGKHDDLVLALALALFWSMRGRRKMSGDI